MCRYRLEDLPTDVSSAESASAVVAVQQYCTLWPLICDKYGIILQWLRKRQGKRLVTVSPEVSIRWLNMLCIRYLGLLSENILCIEAISVHLQNIANIDVEFCTEVVL